MLPADYKEALDNLWNNFWPSSRIQPLPVIALIDALLLCKQLDETQLEKDEINKLYQIQKDPIFKAGQQHFRWSSFKHMYWANLNNLFFRRDGVLHFINKTAKARKLPHFARSKETFTPSAAMLVAAINLISNLEVTSNDKRAAMIEYIFGKANIPRPALQTVPKPKERQIRRLKHLRSQSSKTVLFFLLSFLLGVLATSLAYFNWWKKADPVSNTITAAAYPSKFEEKHVKNISQQNERVKADVTKAEPKSILDKKVPLKASAVPEVSKNKNFVLRQQPTTPGDKVSTQQNDVLAMSKPDRQMEQATGLYKIKSKAYFHNDPDERTRRNAFVNHWNNSYATLKALDEKNGFIYVVFQNHLKQTSKGWLMKKDLRPLTENDRR